MIENANPSVIDLPVTDPRWQSFVSRSPLTLFQSPLWGSIIEQTYGFPARATAFVENGSVVGGLPYASVDDFRGRRRICYAFADVCEPIGLCTLPLLQEALLHGDISWRIRSRDDLAGLAQQNPNCVHHTLQLSTSVAEAQARCHPKQRANVKQAEKAGVTYRKLDDAEGLDIFFTLHSELRKTKHRLLPQPKKFFETIAELYFPQAGFILVAEHQAHPIAAMFFLIQGDGLYYKFSASDMNSLAVRPNHFLLWKGVEEGINLGLRFLDLGISEDEGLSRFKERLGAQHHHVYTFQSPVSQKSAATLQIEQALGRLTEALTDSDVPLRTTQAAGEVLYRFFV